MQAMLDFDDHHWWYRGRRKIIRSELDRLALPIDAKVLDAGCGSGRTLTELAPYGEVFGIELDPDAARVAREREAGEVRIGRLEELPWDADTFDLITCLDVIEHTPDDRATLAELLRVTAPGGVLVATVPAYQSLFSAHDVINGHYRRYRSATLRSAAADAGWSAVADTHFNAVLLAPAAIVRVARRHRSSSRSELTFTPHLLDRALELPMAREAKLIARGHRLPFGLSLLMVLRRPGVSLHAVPAAPASARAASAA